MAGSCDATNLSMARPDLPLQPAPFDPSDSDLASTWDELPLWSAPFGLALLDVVRLRPQLRALDLGCGTGFPLIELAERLGPTSHVVGIDPWAAGCERARFKLQRKGIRHVEIVTGVAERLPFPPDSFDLIVSNNGLNNVADPARALAECLRVARGGAQLVLTVNLPESMQTFYEVFTELLCEQGKEALVVAVREHIRSKRKPRAHMEDLLRAAGFKVNRVLEDEFRLRYASGTALLHQHFVRLAFLQPWWSILPAADAPAFFDCLEERLNRLAEARSELSLAIPFACFDCVKRSG